MDRLIEMVRLHRGGIPNRKAAEMLKMGPYNLQATALKFEAGLLLATHGRATASLQSLLRLAKGLGSPISELLGEELPT